MRAAVNGTEISFAEATNSADRNGKSARNAGDHGKWERMTIRRAERTRRKSSDLISDGSENVSHRVVAKQNASGRISSGKSGDAGSDTGGTG